jgi:tetratricopeptide (TPR) repeat protein
LKEEMRRIYRILILAVAGLMLACAAGPPSEKAPRDIRTSTRYLNKGVLLYTRGCYQQALTDFYESHEHFSAADDLLGIANSLHSIANTYLQLDDIESALLVYQEAIDTYRTLNDDEGQARAWANCAAALIRGGHLEKAAQALDRADALVSSDPELIALRFKNRALLLMAQHQEEAAERLLHRALNKTLEGPPTTVAGFFQTLGELQLKREHPDQALPYLLKALELDRTAGAYHSIAADLESLGICYTRLKQWGKAADCQKRSAKIYSLLQNPKKVQSVVGQLEQSAENAQIDIRSTLHWINQWLAGNTEANLCR